MALWGRVLEGTFTLAVICATFSAGVWGQEPVTPKVVEIAEIRNRPVLFLPEAIWPNILGEAPAAPVRPVPPKTASSDLMVALMASLCLVAGFLIALMIRPR